MNGWWVEPEVRDAVVSYLNHLHSRSNISMKVLLEIVGLRKSKYHQWRKRNGQPNGHNGTIPKEHWLMPCEVSAITEYAKEHYAENDYHLRDGYRRLTYAMMDKDVATASPSSVYRILKKADLLNKWNTDKRSKKGQGFHQPSGIHHHWHTDIKYLNFQGTFLFLITVLDGYSRYVLHHEVRAHMGQHDVQLTLQRAKEKYPLAKPRLITDNGSQFISKEFKSFVKHLEIQHTKTSVAYPQSNGKIERFNRTISEECLRKQSALSVDDIKSAVAEYIEHYNTRRLHGSLHYLTPEDYLLGRKEARLQAREEKMIRAEIKRAEYWKQKHLVA